MSRPLRSGFNIGAISAPVGLSVELFMGKVTGFGKV